MSPENTYLEKNDIYVVHLLGSENITVTCMRILVSDGKVPIWLLQSRCTITISNTICPFYFFYSELIKNIL